MGHPAYFAHPSTSAPHDALVKNWTTRKVRVWEPDLGQMPEELRAALLDSRVLKIAWNVKFEKTCLKTFFNIEIPLEEFFDVMILMSYLSLPRKLDKSVQSDGTSARIA